MCRCNGKQRGGFTLVELLVIVTIISLLALIIIARLVNLTRQAREAVLRSNLYQLRTAITQFHGDTGVYPAALTDLVAGAEGQVQAPVPAGTYKGPYIAIPGGINGTGLPVNPLAAHELDISRHWTYALHEGECTVTSAVTGTTLDGVAYSDL